jgi:hypothetical protein
MSLTLRKDRVTRLEAEIGDLRLRNDILLEENTRLSASLEEKVFPRFHLFREVSNVGSNGHPARLTVGDVKMPVMWRE